MKIEVTAHAVARYRRRVDSTASPEQARLYLSHATAQATRVPWARLRKGVLYKLPGPGVYVVICHQPADGTAFVVTVLTEEILANGRTHYNRGA